MGFGGLEWPLGVVSGGFGALHGWWGLAKGLKDHDLDGFSVVLGPTGHGLCYF
jgi:hypothetical protein